jgi:outer membrane protein OmpA-like peptidoglycan-associated protein
MRKLTTVLALAAVAVPLATAGNALATQIAPLPSCAKGTCSVTFPAVGDSYAWTVPTGVTSLSFDIQGAQGASATTSAGTGVGGKGARVVATWAATPGAVLNVYPGGAGSNASGGWNGGGTGQWAPPSNTTEYSGGGGGASDVRVGGTALSNRVIVAGGGGGGLANTNAKMTGGNGGQVGSAGTGGSGQYSWVCTGSAGGSGGTQSAGGAGGCGNYTRGGAGALGVGGNSSSYTAGAVPHKGGGAGGGGYYGGGGGSYLGVNWSNGSGGGGSSWAAPAMTGVAYTTGARTGAGVVTISFADPDAPLFTSAAPAATLPLGEAYTYTFIATDAVSYAVTSGALPAGLALAADGTLSGTPTTSAISTFVVSTTNPGGTTASQPITITTGMPMTMQPWIDTMQMVPAATAMMDPADADAMAPNAQVAMLPLAMPKSRKGGQEVGVPCLAPTGVTLVSCTVTITTSHRAADSAGGIYSVRRAGDLVIGTATASPASGRSRIALDVRLNAIGRSLVRHSVEVPATAQIVGKDASGMMYVASEMIDLRAPKQTIAPIAGTFATGSATLTAKGRAFVGKLGMVLPHRVKSLTCVGYADSRGSNAYNLTLGEQRAQTLCHALMRRAGIKDSTTRVVTKGEASPRASNDTSDGRARNRRAEVTIVY